MINPIIPAGIEPAAFRFVAQHLNNCATAVPRNEDNTGSNLKEKRQCTIFTGLRIQSDYRLYWKLQWKFPEGRRRFRLSVQWSSWLVGHPARATVMAAADRNYGIKIIRIICRISFYFDSIILKFFDCTELNIFPFKMLILPLFGLCRPWRPLHLPPLYPAARCFPRSVCGGAI